MDAGRALLQIDQGVLVAVHERPQQDAPDDAENGRVGADAKRKRHNHGDRQAFDAGKRPKGKAEVGEKAHMLVCRTAGRQIDRTVILSCSVSLRYVDAANLPGLLKTIARSFIPLAAILMPAGFFLSMISP